MAESYAKSSGWMLKPPLVLVNSCENLAQILVGQILNIPCTPANQENTMDNSIIRWIGLRENLQETMVFTIKYGGFL